MQLIRRQNTWDPFRELEELSSRFNRLIGAGWSRDGEREALATTDWAPACEVSETEREYRIQLELPSVKKDDVQVTLEGGVLTIQGQRREEKEDKGTKFHRRELTYGNFLRRFTMPDDADEGKIEASFKDGMLSVVIAKAKSKPARSRQIAVQ